MNGRRPLPILLFPTLLLGVAMTLPAASAHAEEVQLRFAAGPDDTGTVRRLVDDFNDGHRGKIVVTWVEMPRESDAHHRRLVEALGSDGAPHVFASDVVWTAEFAQSGTVNDATEAFYEDFRARDFLEPARNSATYRLRVWGVPWYSDVSLLFYRRDLLSKSGFDAPPRTWAQLEKIVKKVRADSGTPHGLVFQGADYEGGTANALEFIWGAGGRALRTRLTTDVMGRRVAEMPDLRIDTPEAASGLDIARKLVAEGISPALVADAREKESLAVFLAGEAVFLRNWPYVSGLLEGSALEPEQVGVAALPGVSDGTGVSCLGGWNLMTSARNTAAEQRAAWTFVRYLTSTEVQKKQAVQAGLLPARVELYDDATVAKAVPALAVGKALVAGSARARPALPQYEELSDYVSRTFRRVLKGEVNGAQAVKMLEKELRKVAIANR